MSGEKKRYPNSGILGRNKRRRGDKDPEYSGQAEINGVEYWLSAWVNEGNEGKYFKISFTPKNKPQGNSGGNQQRRNDDDDDGDPNVPF